MSIHIRQRGPKLQYDIYTRGPDDKSIHERKNVPEGIRSKADARVWAERRANYLAHHGNAPEAPPVPTLKEFSERWMEEYAKATW